VDTIVYVIMMIGASLAMALLFASTVLSYKWWNLPLIHRLHTSKNGQQKRRGREILIPQRKVVEVKSQSQSLVDLKCISNRSELIKKTSNKTIFSLSIPAYSAVTGDLISTNRGSQ
jgi:predicted ATP-binding protein involved in virulence